MANKKIALIPGSVRTGSFSVSIANALKSLAPEGYELEIVDISKLTLFNQDLEEEGKTPAEWTQFREAVKAFDGVIFVTPEYNRSVPPVLKNAIDIASRPYGASVWNGKPGAVVSVSPGSLAGFGANHHLRQTLSFLNIPVMQQPEAYIGEVYKFLDEQGNLANEDTKAFLKEFLAAYAVWFEKNI